jgi:hypothetical protein
MLSVSLSTVEEIAAVAGVVAVGGIAWLSFVRDRFVRRRAELREHRRARRAEAAAVEASLEDEAFAPELVRSIVGEVLAFAEDVWREVEPRTARRVDAGVIRFWARSLVAWLGTDLRLVGEPSVDFLRVINRPGEAEDRVVLRVRLRVHRAGRVAIGEPRTVVVDERWTLGRADGEWMLLSIDSDPLAPRVLAGGLIPAEWADRERLREQSLAELGSADAVGEDTDLSGLVSPDAPPAQQLLDLSQIDGRFDRELLYASISHLVEAWEEACTGSQGPLAAVASPDAVGVLLHPPGGDRGNRLVLRDAEVEGWEPTSVLLSSRPARVEIRVTVSAVRYMIASLSGAHVGGSVEIRHEMPLEWTLALSTSSTRPWRLMHTSNPAKEIPGIDP